MDQEHYSFNTTGEERFILHVLVRMKLLQGTVGLK